MKNNILKHVKITFAGLLLVIGMESCGIFSSKKSQTSCPANVQTGSSSRQSKRQTSCPANVHAYYASNDNNKKNCPPAGIGAEKLIKYMDKYDLPDVKMEKYDPLTGKMVNEKQGIKSGELEKKKKKLQEEEKKLSEQEKKELKLIKKQIARDKKEAIKEQPMF